MRNTVKCILLSTALVSLAAFAASEAGRYLTRAEFLDEAFGNKQPASGVVWVDDELRELAKEILGHAPDRLRIRYWYEDNRTAWIINEIGKEQPITFGIVVENSEIQALRVMQFRETRGWEIRYPFFTQQFEALRLDAAGELSHGIDSISGATLSVKAATRSANFALALDEYTRRSQQESTITP